MILRIRNSWSCKVTSIALVLAMLISLNPFNSLALTGGPKQPEFNSFTPIGTSDMVDLASGDFSYNIPLMDVGGFPINISYNSGVTNDQEASWVGLGWNLSIGQINRDMRGIPDDFDGDLMRYEKNIKPNNTYSASFQFSPELVGKDVDGNPTDTALIGKRFGATLTYNSYDGISISPSLGLSYEFGKICSAGLNITSGPGGLVIAPNISLKAKLGSNKNRDLSLNSSVGTSFNTRQGLSQLSISNSIKGVKSKKYFKSARLNSSSTLSFSDNTYTPTIQNGIITENTTYNYASGTTVFGAQGEAEITALISEQYLMYKVQNLEAYGYNNTQKGDRKSILDFNREKDGNFGPNSTNLPITNYTYDIYTVEGQGVSGMFHPYRSQVGYVYDNETNSSSPAGTVGLELEVGSSVHSGADLEATFAESQTGLWEERNEALESFQEGDEDYLYEEVYYKNFGDLSYDSDYQNIYGSESTKLGKLSPICLNLGVIPYLRKLKNTYLIKKEDAPGYHSYDIVTNDIKRSQRESRNQAIQEITVTDASSTEVQNLGFRINPSAKEHHTAGFIITRKDGARYIYGKAIYNKLKREVTFAVGDPVGGSSGGGLTGDCDDGLVDYLPGVNNSINNTFGNEYFDAVQTPEYAHSYLLTSILSTDYSDIDGVDGPSSGDLGSYTIFTYHDDIEGNEAMEYNWRVPFQQNKANYNEGITTDPSDDMGSYIYGEKELTYIERIETKTHIAIFSFSDRSDAIGVSGENGGAGSGRMQKLDRIELYSVGEFYFPGTSSENPSAVPIKTVNFVYDYSLCPNVPNHLDVDEYGDLDLDGSEEVINSDRGKLTLKKLYFTYRNSNMGKYSPYVFNYNTPNPQYNIKAYDVWGNYKPNPSTDCSALSSLSAPEYNYTEQDESLLDTYLAAWTLNEVELPSGGKIQVDFESDDYNYVQDKKAMRMFKLAGAGECIDPSTCTDNFEFEPTLNFLSQTDEEALFYKNYHDANFLYFELDELDQDPTILLSEVQSNFYENYLLNINQRDFNRMYFRVLTNTTRKGGKKNGWENAPFDYVTGYCEIEPQNSGVFEYAGKRYGSVKLKAVNLEGGFAGSADFHPIAKAGIHYVRKYLPKYVYELETDSEGDDAVIEMMYQFSQNMAELFAGPNGLLKGKNIAKRFIPEKSWIRLDNPHGAKKGGGTRVKQIVLTDEWAQMNSDDSPVVTDDYRDQKYGQVYTYKNEDGTSSGVATYEPIGAKDNPFVQPVAVNVKRLLAPDEENYLEAPFGESFFPSAAVTYSRVEVKNIERINETVSPSRVVKKHATGKVVTEFFTSRDYPTITDQTELLVHEDSNPLLQGILNINIVKHLTLSQGYSVHVNDMNGKMKAQRVYAEDEDAFISSVEYHYGEYEATDISGATSINPYTPNSYNRGNLNNQVKILMPNGAIENGIIGEEQHVINDFRMMESKSHIAGINANGSTFIIGAAPVFIVTFLPDYTRYQDKLNISTTTKVTQTFGVLKSTKATDAGASVYTKNLLWDGKTGEVLLTETINEYDDKYYSLNLPAYWYYKLMGQSSENSNAVIDANIVSGPTGIYETANSVNASNYLNRGDELLITTSGSNYYAWVSEVSGTDEFTLIDSDGNLLDLSSESNISMKIIRSGKRNLQNTSMASIVLQKNPLEFAGVSSSIPANWLNQTSLDVKRIINAGAVEFSDEWDLQCECGLDIDATRNPYRYNQLGVWRANKSFLYLTGRTSTISSDHPDTRNEGFYNDFTSYYNFNGTDWVIDPTNWTYTSEITQINNTGFEIENKDALNRYSAATYGYNLKFPLAVGANTEYRQIGYDGFEDYDFDGCATEEHFGFRDETTESQISTEKSHTGKYSLKVSAGGVITKYFNTNCER